jgi:peptide/nickel transport system permease protein
MINTEYILLWTDGLLYFLLLCCVGYIYKIKKNPILFAQWQKGHRHPVRISALIILIVFMSLAMLDSIHFKPNKQTKVYSALDYLLWPMGEQSEKTYSAPFAVKSYTGEMIEVKPSVYRWEYARLAHAGKHLNFISEQKSDVLKLGLVGLLIGIVVWLLIILVNYWLIKKYKYIGLLNNKTVQINMLILCCFVSLTYAYLGKYHILGTDKVGQDVFYMSIKSIRTGVVIGTLTTLVMLPFAVFLGTIAGYFRGWVDDVIQYIYITISSIPSVLLIAASVLSLQVFMNSHDAVFNTMLERTDLRLLMLCFILGLTSWTNLCRLLRAEVLKLREMEFVLAAKSIGVHQLKIIYNHIIPNLIHIILIAIALDFSGLVLAEAVLSYVGVGVDPATYSWGNMINTARLEMAREPVVWWSLFGAFVMMFLLVLAANIFSDSVRDIYDPKVNE